MSSHPSIADSHPEVREPSALSWRALVVSVALMALVLSISWWRLQPPSPKPVDAPEREFSALRAEAVLERLLGEQVPHPVGTDEHQAVLGRLESEIRALGLEPSRQASFALGQGVAAHVQNVIVELPGPTTGPVIALTCHYDSVDAGPGAADDGAGVAAILEVARALMTDGAQPQRVILLFTDGEEVALLGARAFVEEHALASDIRVALNLEARGTSGPSLLFETSRDNRWLANAFARGSERPVTGSTFTRVYEAMPNGTDLTEFNGAGWSGANFAFIGGVSRYHTPLDDLEHLDRGSLQQQGDNVLGMVRALADVDLKEASSESGTFFDVLSFFVVDWTPIGPALPVVAVLLLVLAILDIRSGAHTWRSLAAGGLAVVALPVLAIGAGFALFALAGGVWETPFPAAVAPFHKIALALSIAMAFGLYSPLRKLAGQGDVTAGFWLVWALIGTALQFTEPQVSYLFAFPAVVHLTGQLLARVLGKSRPGAAQFISLNSGPIATALVWAPFVFLLPDAIGVTNAAVMIGPWAIIVSALATLLLRSESDWGCLAATVCVVALIGSVAESRLSPYTEHDPQGMTLRYHVQPETGTAAWVAELRNGELPQKQPAYQDMAPSEPSSVPPIRRSSGQYERVAQIEGVFEAPRVANLQRTPNATGFQVTGRLVSPRGARHITLLFPNDGRFGALKIDGRAAQPRWTAGNQLAFTVRTLPPEGLAFEVDFTGSARVRARLIDETPGLPDCDAADALIKERNGTVPFQRRDATLVSAEVRF